MVGVVRAVDVAPVAEELLDRPGRADGRRTIATERIEVREADLQPGARLGRQPQAHQPGLAEGRSWSIRATNATACQWPRWRNTQGSRTGRAVRSSTRSKAGAKPERIMGAWRPWPQARSSRPACSSRAAQPTFTEPRRSRAAAPPSGNRG